MLRTHQRTVSHSSSYSVPHSYFVSSNSSRWPPHCGREVQGRAVRGRQVTGCHAADKPGRGAQLQGGRRQAAGPGCLLRASNSWRVLLNPPRHTSSDTPVELQAGRQARRQAGGKAGCSQQQHPGPTAPTDRHMQSPHMPMRSRVPPSLAFSGSPAAGCPGLTAWLGLGGRRGQQQDPPPPPPLEPCQCHPSAPACPAASQPMVDTRSSRAHSGIGGLGCCGSTGSPPGSQWAAGLCGGFVYYRHCCPTAPLSHRHP